MQVLVFAQDETANKKEEEDIRKENMILKINRNQFKLKLPVSAKEVIKSIMQGETKIIESVFRPMEFREPIYEKHQILVVLLKNFLKHLPLNLYLSNHTNQKLLFWESP